jgi:hypothetical protein
MAKEQLLEQYTDLYQAAANMGLCVLERVMQAVQLNDEAVQYWSSQRQQLQKDFDQNLTQLEGEHRRLTRSLTQAWDARQHAIYKVPQTNGTSGVTAIPSRASQDPIAAVLAAEQAYKEARFKEEHKFQKALAAAQAQLLKELSYDAACSSDVGGTAGLKVAGA